MGVTKRSSSPVSTRDLDDSSSDDAGDIVRLLPGQKDIRIYLIPKSVHADLARCVDADEEASKSMGLSFTIDDDSDVRPPDIFDDLLLLQAAETESAQALFANDEHAALAMGYSLGIYEVEDDSIDYEFDVAVSESCQIGSWEFAALNESVDLFATHEDSARMMGLSFDIDSETEGSDPMDPASSLLPSPSTPTGGVLDAGGPGAPSTPKRLAPDDITKHTPVWRPKRPRIEKCDRVIVVDKMSTSDARIVEPVMNS